MFARVFSAFFLSVVVFCALSEAGDAEESKLVVGTWTKFGAGNLVYKADGTFTQGFSTGTWKVSDGKLVQVRDGALTGTVVEKLEFVVTKNSLTLVHPKYGKESWTRK